MGAHCTGAGTDLVSAQAVPIRLRFGPVEVWGGQQHCGGMVCVCVCVCVAIATKRTCGRGLRCSTGWPSMGLCLA